MGWKNSGTPAAFHLDGNITRSPKQIANLQLDYFHNKVDKLLEALPNTTIDPLKLLKDAISRWKNKFAEVPSLKIQPVGRNTTLKYLQKIGNGVSFGYDGIDGFSLKIVADILVDPINFITNLSISKNKFANKWKIGRVIPLHKGKDLDKMIPSSYRPISLLPAVSKIIEKSVQVQIMDHMSQHKLWNRNLHSYRGNHSTNTALGQLLDTIYEDSEDKLISNVMAIDESAAFDCLRPNILLEKLECYNFHQDTIMWIQSYLSSRSQFVSIGGQSSRMREVKYGVPQGSILGPVLYNIYINELSDIVNEYQDCTDDAHVTGDELFGRECRKCGNLTCYADNAIYSIGSKSRSWNQTRLRIILDRLKVFLNANGMSINKSKTVLMEAMVHQRESKSTGEPPKIPVQLENGDFKDLKAAKECVILGATLHKNIQWQSHIMSSKDSLLSTLRKRIGRLKYLGRNIPWRSKKLLAEGLVISKLLYVLPLYGGTYKSYLSKLQCILNTAARFISGSGRRTKTIELMRKIKWLSFKELRDYHSLLFMWRIVRLQAPGHLATKIMIDNEGLVTVKFPRLQNTAMGFRWRTAWLWNNLDREIRVQTSYVVFKRSVKNWILSRREPEPDDSTVQVQDD